MIVDEVGLLILVVEGVLLFEDVVVDEVSLGLEDVIEVNRVVLPVVEVEDFVTVDDWV